MSVQTYKIGKYFVPNETNMSSFHPFEVVGRSRSSGTQLQVVEIQII